MSWLDHPLATARRTSDAFFQAVAIPLKIRDDYCDHSILKHGISKNKTTNDEKIFVL
jgi:hypothetical protein